MKIEREAKVPSFIWPSHQQMSRPLAPLPHADDAPSVTPAYPQDDRWEKSQPVDGRLGSTTQVADSSLAVQHWSTLEQQQASQGHPWLPSFHFEAESNEFESAIWYPASTNSLPHCPSLTTNTILDNALSSPSEIGSELSSPDTMYSDPSRSDLAVVTQSDFDESSTLKAHRENGNLVFNNPAYVSEREGPALWSGSNQASTKYDRDDPTNCYDLQVADPAPSIASSMQASYCGLYDSNPNVMSLGQTQYNRWINSLTHYPPLNATASSLHPAARNPATPAFLSTDLSYSRTFIRLNSVRSRNADKVSDFAPSITYQGPEHDDIVAQEAQYSLPSVAQDDLVASQRGHERRVEDQILLDGKQAGLTYKEIRRRMKTAVAESTLRGRYRSLTKARKDRVRKPVWTEKDVSLRSPLSPA